MKNRALILFTCLALFAQAQFDTTFGSGTFYAVDTASGMPISGAALNYKAIAIDDTLFATAYTDTTNPLGEVNFTVPTHFRITIGMNEWNAQQGIFYPNPATDLNVLLTTKDDYTLMLYDVNGKLVLQHHAKQTEHLYVDLEHLADGLYVAEVRGTQTTSTTAKIYKRTGKKTGKLKLDVAEGFGKVAGNGAIYRVYVTPPFGYKRDSVEVTLQDGANGTVPIAVQRYDTLRTAVQFQVLPAVEGVQVHLQPKQVADLLPNVLYQDSTAANGQTPPIHVITAIDTLNPVPSAPSFVYDVTLLPPKGWVRDTLSISAGGLHQVSLNAWDTATANQPIRTRNTITNSTIPNIPLNIEVQIAEDVADTVFINYTTSVAGVAIATENNEIDTTGTNTFSNNGTTWIISSPYVHTMSASDSLNPNLQYTGFDTATDIITVFNGTNPTFNHFKNPTPVPQWHGKQRIGITAGQFDKDFNRTAADSALVVFYNQTQNTTDTVTLDVNGEGKGPWANNGDTIFVGSGYVGGVGTNGENLKMIKGVEIDIAGATFANPDTITELKYNFLPDSVNVSALGVTEGISDQELKWMHKRPAIENQLDTVTIYINPSGFTSLELGSIQSVIDSANQIFPIYTKTVSSPLSNPNPPSGYPTFNQWIDSNYSNSLYGMNVSQGSNNLTNVKNVVSNIIGEGLNFVIADSQVSAARAELWAEMYYNRFAFGGIPASYQLSVTNGVNPTLPTTWDFANFILKYHFEHEMFKGTTPASTGTPTQNISVNFYYDDNNITAQ